VEEYVNSEWLQRNACAMHGSSQHPRPPDRALLRCTDTGLMWTLAPKLGALLVFAEHRYEGESFPEVEGMPACMSYCSSAEALADFAALITTIKTERHATRSPVVAFGGSYGGMLSSWFRIKCDHFMFCYSGFSGRCLHVDHAPKSPACPGLTGGGGCDPP
jgi:hypothetical protein